MSGVEARYRRWLALYPRDFRDEYADEMLGVLMSDGRPGPWQFLDLLRAAVAVRLRRVRAPHAFRQAARLVQLFGALLLLANAVRLVLPIFVDLGLPAALDAVDTVEVVRVAAWSLVLIAALSGRRLLGFAAASVGLAGEIAAPARFYLDTPATVLNAYWIIMAVAVVLIAGLIAVRDNGRPRGLGLVLTASVMLALLNEVDWAVPMKASWMVLRGSGGDIPMLFVNGSVTIGGVLMLLSIGVLTALGVIRQEAAVRRWLLAWAAPVLVTVPLIRTGFGAFREYNSYHPEATRLIDPLQWTVLMLVPFAAFLVVASLTSRYERGRG
ncbi:hypothetical protein ACQP2E_34300 [Actinoplanes sp. CA-015351]|uniref:hypothetical protein n=1 Tax=Actinoplanes sp. CA-015351 TaxID=3239897 RepID=UPI003D95956F